MVVRLLVLLGVALIGGWSAPASANMGDMRFKVMQDCSSQEGCELVALGVGSITPATPSAMNEFMRSNPNVKKYFFHSPGGDVQAGLNMGVALRKRGMDTALTSKMRCFSSCAYVFLGGNSREVRPGGVVGVHRFRSNDGQAGEQAAQVLVSHLVNYVEGMGVSPKMVDLASRAGAAEIIGIGWKDARALRIDNSTTSPAHWSLNSIEDVLAVAAVEFDEASDREVTIMAGDIGSYVVVMGSVKYPALRPQQTHYDNRVRVCIQESCIDSIREVRKDQGDRTWTAVWTMDRSEFLDLMNAAYDIPDAEVVFVIKSDEEVSLIRGPAKSFNTLFQRTGPSENRLYVEP